MASEGYRVLDESPLDSFHGTGLAEFHAYALLAAGNVVEAHAVSEHQHLQYAELPGLVTVDGRCRTRYDGARDG